jgi:hypothetical protein
MTNEVERIWKEAVVAYSRNYSNTGLEGSRKITNDLRIAGDPTEIRTEHLANLCLELYLYNSLFDVSLYVS